MTTPGSSSGRRTVIRASTVLLAAAVAMTAAVSMWAGDRAVLASAKALVLRSSSVVGAAPGATLSPAKRLGPPVPISRSTCRNDLGGAVLTITIPDIAENVPSVTAMIALYRVVGRLYVTVSDNRVVDASGSPTGEATLDSIIRPDHGGNRAARLSLQTCDGDTHRWMIYADLVTG
ncbi:MAG: hypothetical protein ACXVH5_01405 [Ilumatobacteraceae bacterium]